MQKRFAGINPSCDVFSPMMQISRLLTPATTRPYHTLRPTRIVESTVKRQDK
jgi:hypothetical protein